jgi:hypothetical protein
LTSIEYSTVYKHVLHLSLCMIMLVFVYMFVFGSIYTYQRKHTSFVFLIQANYT